jgi:membrane fusion protein, multidrug efflux system
MRRKFRFGAVSVANVVITTAILQAQLAMAAPGEQALASAIVQTAGGSDSAGFDGVVEALRQTVIAAQVPGTIIAIAVKTGDVVRQGQVLARIDARAAMQNSAAGEAQVQAARSALDVATKDYERQRQLFQKQYISQASLERSEAQFRATSAQLTAQIAQASAAHIQSDFFVVKAPYTGVIADIPVTLGDMAMPGRPLMTLYDPVALRVTASVPQSALANFAAGQSARLELPALPADLQWLTRPEVQVLPTIDAGTHSAQVRVNLPGGIKGVAPGMFARVWLPNRSGATGRLYVPRTAIVQRAEMTGLYVIDAQGRPMLRQVRLGRTQNNVVEVLAGVASGERVALGPQAAAKDRR